MNSSSRLAVALVLLCAMAFVVVSGRSTLDEFVGVCLRNCAQCKKMFGAYFLGSKCADACVLYKGKNIPDCEDAGSIEPYLQALDNDY